MGRKQMHRDVRKRTIGPVRPAKIQIRLRAQSDQNLHWTHFGYQRMQRFFMWTTHAQADLKSSLGAFV